MTESKVQFVVETHSEYLIRRTQVMFAEMVKEMNLPYEDTKEKIPFKTYYFPEEGVPYDMIYRIDGRFYEEFGSGFFDVASNLAFSLF